VKRFVIVLFTIILLLTLTGCGYEETKTYDIISSRVWVQITESGTFTTKTNSTTYIEIIYKNAEGFQKVDKIPVQITIGDTTKVVEEKGELYPDFYMTTDYYNQLFKEESNE
jgi:hypothetical protein